MPSHYLNQYWLVNGPISQSHNAPPVPYPTMHHFGTEMCTFLFQSDALWDIGQVHFEIYYQYRKSHCGNKTIVRSSYLHRWISYTGNMASNSNSWYNKEFEFEFIILNQPSALPFLHHCYALSNKHFQVWFLSLSLSSLSIVSTSEKKKHWTGLGCSHPIIS